MGEVDLGVTVRLKPHFGFPELMLYVGHYAIAMKVHLDHLIYFSMKTYYVSITVSTVFL